MLWPCLATLGYQSNTILVERLNHTIRQHVVTVGHRVTTACKGADSLQQLALCHVYVYFLLFRMSLRVPLAEFEPTNGMHGRG